MKFLLTASYRSSGKRRQVRGTFGPRNVPGRRSGAVSAPPLPLEPCHSYSSDVDLLLYALKFSRQPKSGGGSCRQITHCFNHDLEKKNYTFHVYCRPFWIWQTIVFKILLTDFADEEGLLQRQFFNIANRGYRP